jgi:phosphohistidine phosphatase
VDVFILRHGKAEDAGHGTDASRRLTKKGHDEVVAIADWMAGQGLAFDLIAASPLVRAQETAAIVAEVLETPERLVTWKILVPGGNPDTVCHELSRHADAGTVLLVGHEPLLSSLIARIIAGESGAGIIMTKGALAKIRNFSFTNHPSGDLHWLITAKQMAGGRHRSFPLHFCAPS